MQGNFFKNKEILNGWKEIMFLENESTDLEELDEMNWSTGGNVLNQLYLRNTSIGTTVKHGQNSSSLLLCH